MTNDSGEARGRFVPRAKKLLRKNTIAIKFLFSNFLALVKRRTILRLNRYLCHFRESFSLFELWRENSFQGTLLTSTEKTLGKLCLRLSLCGRFSPSRMREREREIKRKKTTMRAAAKKAVFKTSRRTEGRGERGPFAIEERPPRFKRGFSMLREYATILEIKF